MSDNGKSGFNYLSSAFSSFIFVGLLVFMWPDLIPFGYFQFWTVKGSLLVAVTNAWPIYLFGIGINLTLLFRRDDYPITPREILYTGFGISLWSGVMEELCFRWIIFISAIVMIPVADWLFLGFMDVHIVRWFYGILCPVANFFTLGYLHQYLLDGYGWAVGAAIISSNGKFRNGHGYQGLLGFIVSWFIGMYFFWVMFTHGLIAAMVIHFLYDLFIFLLVVLDSVLEQRRWA